METRVIKLADIKPAPYNPRVQLTPKDQEYKALDASIEENGLVLPLIVNIRDNCLIGGHQRLSVLLAAGETEKAAARKAEKKAIEDARFVLPNACETKIVITMNVRELLHFFELRCCNRAQWEIREVAEQMLALVKPIAPTIFAKAGPGCVSGPCPEGRMTCGKAAQVRKKYLQGEAE